MYRFARSPRWIASHLLVIALVVTMINLGLWQLRRLDDKRERNDRIVARTEEPAAEVAELARGAASAESLEYRIGLASGSYVAADELLVRNRTLNGRPGYWVLTPLDLGGGQSIMVNRGWIPVLEGEGRDRPPAPPAGRVELRGLLRLSEQAVGLQRADPAEGVLSIVSRPDIGRIQQQVDSDLLPVYLQLTESPDGTLPIAVPMPDLDEGPHLSYAVQWFIFTTVALVGYPLILRKVARERAAPAA